MESTDNLCCIVFHGLLTVFLNVLNDPSASIDSMLSRSGVLQLLLSAIFFVNGLRQGPKLQRRHSKWNRRPDSRHAMGFDMFRWVSGSGVAISATLQA